MLRLSLRVIFPSHSPYLGSPKYNINIKLLLSSTMFVNVKYKYFQYQYMKLRLRQTLKTLHVHSFLNELTNPKIEWEQNIKNMDSYGNIFLERINNICRRIRNPQKSANHIYVQSIFCWSYCSSVPIFLTMLSTCWPTYCSNFAFNKIIQL